MNRMAKLNCCRQFLKSNAVYSCWRSSHASSTNSFVHSVDVFVFDCDGVLWRGGNAISGAMNTISFLREKGKSIYFVTNSTESRSSLIKKFNKFGLSVTQKEILCASFAAAAYLEQKMLGGKSAYVVGEPGIVDEIQQAGISVIGGSSHDTLVPNLGPGGHIAIDGNIGAVVVGFDPFINYYKIQYAQLCINTIPNCLFVATNLDATCHQTDAQLWADAGAMVGALQGCTGKTPIVVGKPSSFLVDYIVGHEHVLDRKRICMIGDRIDTDIDFGKNNGMKTILALTGVTTAEDLKAANLSEDKRPDLVIKSVADLITM